jgi:hypothetical protein
MVNSVIGQPYVVEVNVREFDPPLFLGHESTLQFPIMLPGVANPTEPFHLKRLPIIEVVPVKCSPLRGFSTTLTIVCGHKLTTPKSSGV